MAAATAPVAIGTRGTIGSLVRKEIDYFTKLELDRCVSSRKPHQTRIFDVGNGSCSSGHHSKSSFWSLRLSWKRKKRRGSSGNGFFPSICSAVEVTDTNRLNGIPGFNYRILNEDAKEMTF